jgi:hypothetical protein
MKTRFVGLILVSIILTGCGGTQESSLDTALFQLSVNRGKWMAGAIHAYSFDYDVVSMLASRPLHIEVRNDLVAQVTDRTSGAVYSNAGAPTVDSLFTLVERLVRSPSPDVTVTYDGQLGYPIKIENGSSIPDTGSTTTISNFQQLP